jgi:hypothetical protein
MYPYVIPFSGAALAGDRELLPYTVHERREIRGTHLAWDQPAKILPMDSVVRDTVLTIEREYESLLGQQQQVAHLPSRVRSMLWILASLEPMAVRGFPVANDEAVRAALEARLPARQPPAILATA